jgi:predicted O-methyltransferase YrrM
MQERWDAVDAFIEGELVGQDDALREAAGGIAVSPAQGKLLHLLARSIGARRVLELGTLYGYSAIWLARALPDDGELITLEVDAGNAERARANVDRAGVGAKVDIRVGPAAETVAGVDGPFDLVFLDADKQSAAEYLGWALRLTAPGSLIVADNVVRGGALADADSADPRVQGVRRLHELLAAETAVCATTIQTVGAKGYDGFTLALVTG